jgi:MFS superfamily sulfate permease-like transporter
VIYRFGAALFYANAARFAKEVRDLATPDVRWMVIDAEAITHVDYSASRVFCEVHRELASHGIVMAFARVQSELKADMDRHHLTEAIGEDRIFRRLHNARAQFAKESPAR